MKSSLHLLINTFKFAIGLGMEPRTQTEGGSHANGKHVAT